MPLETLRRMLRVPDPVAEAALQGLVGTGRLRRLEGLVSLAGFTPSAPGGAAAVTEVVALLEVAGLTPPSVAELERETGRRDVAGLLRLAAAAGQVEAVERDRYFTRTALERFAAALRESDGREGVVPSQLRQRLGISRKYLIPLLEWADARGLTEWEGEVRRVRNRPHA
jgi:selenocysteine-specific elongation factor